MDQSFEKKLPEESVKTLINYLKLLKEMRQAAAPPPAPKGTDAPPVDDDHFTDLSDEDLKKLTKKPKTGDQNV